MELIKKVWVESDRGEFLEYLRTFARPDKVEWTRKIINTKLELLAIPTPIIRGITKEIAKGDFLSFLKLGIKENYEAIGINGGLITKIKQFNIMESYLIEFAKEAENWATCDLLNISITGNKVKWWELAKKLIKEENQFARRVGIIILFKFITEDDYIDSVFEILSGFTAEKEYYVNMVNAWLVAECFVKQRDKTIEFLERKTLNNFTVNKAISKCRESYRVSAEDKEMLLRYKIKQ